MCRCCCPACQEMPSVLPSKPLYQVSVSESKRYYRSSLQDGCPGHPTADPEASLAYAFLPQVVQKRTHKENEKKKERLRKPNCLQQPKRRGEKGAGGTDEEGKVDAQDGRSRGGDDDD